MSTNRLPDDYHAQDACANCRHVFVWEEYDETNEWYCTLDALPRPICMSTYLKEKPVLRDTDSLREARQTWNAWKVGREVLPNGICSKFLSESS